MKKQDFRYHLPPHLIAQRPPAQRRDCRLLYLNGATGTLQHKKFADLSDCLQRGDLLVFNDTRVIPARLYGAKSSGGKVEILVERLLGKQQMLAQVRASKTPKAGMRIHLHQGKQDDAVAATLQVIDREQDFFVLRLEGSDNLEDLLPQVGHTPLPPYIARADDRLDAERYQTVYAQRPGAVAAPTAGLHFDAELMTQLQVDGIDVTFVTLHVGAGTFQPLRVDDVREHRMHAEYLEVAESACSKILAARKSGGRIIAVGTTSVRCLETAGRAGPMRPYRGDTRLFIYPGFKFQWVDALITNFHLPESTLLMLVSAFAGRDNILRAYREAIAQGYRFFSYGDAMFIEAKRPRAQCRASSA